MPYSVSRPNTRFIVWQDNLGNAAMSSRAAQTATSSKLQGSIKHQTQGRCLILIGASLSGAWMLELGAFSPSLGALRQPRDDTPTPPTRSNARRCRPEQGNVDDGSKAAADRRRLRPLRSRNPGICKCRYAAPRSQADKPDRSADRSDYAGNESICIAPLFRGFAAISRRSCLFVK